MASDRGQQGSLGQPTTPSPKVQISVRAGAPPPSPHPADVLQAQALAPSMPRVWALAISSPDRTKGAQSAVGSDDVPRPANYRAVRHAGPCPRRDCGRRRRPLLPLRCGSNRTAGSWKITWPPVECSPIVRTAACQIVQEARARQSGFSSHYVRDAASTGWFPRRFRDQSLDLSRPGPAPPGPHTGQLLERPSLPSSPTQPPYR